MRFILAKEDLEQLLYLPLGLRVGTWAAAREKVMCRNLIALVAVRIVMHTASCLELLQVPHTGLIFRGRRNSFQIWAKTACQKHSSW